MPSVRSASISASISRADLVHLVRTGAGVDDEQTGVVVQRGVGVHRVREAALARGSPGTAGSTARRPAPGSARPAGSGRRRGRSRPAMPRRGGPARCRAASAPAAAASATGARALDGRAAGRPANRSAIASTTSSWCEVAGADDDEVGRPVVLAEERGDVVAAPSLRSCRSCPAPRGRAGGRGTSPRGPACGPVRPARPRTGAAPRGSPGARRRPRRARSAGCGHDVGQQVQAHRAAWAAGRRV